LLALERAARYLNLLVAFTLLVFAPFVAAAQEGSGIHTVMQKLAVLDQYFASPTAERILASNATGVSTALARTRGMMVDARDSLDAGDVDRAKELADAALQELSTASRLANRQASPPALHQARFEELFAGVRTFRQPLEAALKTRPAAKTMLIEVESLDAELAQTAELAKMGQYEKANGILVDVYETIAAGLSSMHESETIIYRLEFATPADEFDYEKQRYQTQQALAQMVLEKGSAAAGIRKLVERYISKGRKAHEAAEAQVAANDYETAIAGMEQANEHLTRGLAMLGLPVMP
jgi:hypothetical protein